MRSEAEHSTTDFLNNAQRELHESAKRWLNSAKASQSVVLLISVAATVWSIYPGALSLIASVLTLYAVGAQWRSDHLKGLAQFAQRKFEFLDSLGWDLSSIELRNLHARLPGKIREKLDRTPSPPFEYYESKQQTSSRRLLENLSESSFFTQHVSLTSAYTFSAVSLLVFVLAFVTLILALQIPVSQTAGTTLAKTVTSVLVFLFSAGIVRLSYEFFRFSQQAKTIEQRAHEMLNSSSIPELEAVRLFHEYQIARAGAPLLPTWIWGLMRDNLNKRWTQYQSTSENTH